MKDLQVFRTFSKASVHWNGQGSECHQKRNGKMKRGILFWFSLTVLNNKPILHPSEYLIQGDSQQTNYVKITQNIKAVFFSITVFIDTELNIHEKLINLCFLLKKKKKLSWNYWLLSVFPHVHILCSLEWT